MDFKLIFAHDVRECPPLLFACGYLVASAPFFGTNSSFPTELSWHPSRESIDYRCEDFFLDSDSFSPLEEIHPGAGDGCRQAGVGSVTEAEPTSRRPGRETMDSCTLNE